MGISEKLCFVQFMHPGGEPSAKNGAKWRRNAETHARKYLRVGGQYLDCDDKSASVQIEFWGEWEAKSELIQEFGRQGSGLPQRVWRPYYEQKADYTGLQNTDPFVFGGFYYTGCKQRTQKGPTQLRYLKRGSVLLFGSSAGGKFILDTVFVVRDWIDHDLATYRRKLAGMVPNAYRDVTLYPRYQREGCGYPADMQSCAKPPSCNAPESDWRLYFGATYDEPFEGMFSFFPCLPSYSASAGFARPVIELPDIINPESTQANRLNPQKDLTNVVRLWQRVVEQVRAQGLDLGIAAEVPPSRRP